MNQIKTGIIGCGKVAHLHAAALRDAPESAFTAVCSRSRDRARAFAERYRVAAFTDLDEFFDRSGVEAVIVCTPHPAHAAAAIRAARAGVHVLVEKPLAASLADCDAMIDAAEQAAIKLGVVSQRRFYAPVQRVKKAIDDGKIGRPVLAQVTMLGWRDETYYQSDPWRGRWRAEGGGVLVNQAPHQLDLLQWFLGPIEELFGYWANLNHPTIEVEDTAIAVLRFRSGALGAILASNAQNPALYGRVHVHGANGASIGVQTDGGAMFVAGMSDIAEPPINDLWTVPREEHCLEKWQQEDADFFGTIQATEYYHKLQAQDFLQAIQQDRDPLVTASQGRVTVEIFTAIYRAQRDKAPVRFPLSAETDRDDYDGRYITPP
ncbi:MAG: Gfo/Idh/MocA family oxidoreductase [Sedimentisphaerales bacterium]|nr:Gfo/Idh/MocA family oxidoreductase [Sedimentisphaerales bacterium]